MILNLEITKNVDRRELNSVAHIPPLVVSRCSVNYFTAVFKFHFHNTSL